MTKKHTPEQERKASNMQHHIDRIDEAVKFLKSWPCVTTINNLRNCLDLAERDIKTGDAAVTKAAA